MSAIAVHTGHATGSAFVTLPGRRQPRTSSSTSAQRRRPGRHRRGRAEHDRPAPTTSMSWARRCFPTAPPRSLCRRSATVKAKGGTVSFDPNIRPEIMQASGMREALDQVLSADRPLPAERQRAVPVLIGRRRRGRGRRNPAARGVHAIVVKKGADGASLPRPHGTVACPAFAVEEVDPTGAGDCFGAAFVTSGCAARRQSRRSRSPMPAVRSPSSRRGRWKVPPRWPSSRPSQPPPERPAMSAATRHLPASRRRAPPASARHRLDLLGASAGDRGGAPPWRGAWHRCADRGDLQPGQPGRRLHRHDAGRLPRIRRGDRRSRPASRSSA